MDNYGQQNLPNFSSTYVYGSFLSACQINISLYVCNGYKEPNGQIFMTATISGYTDVFHSLSSQLPLITCHFATILYHS